MLPKRIPKTEYQLHFTEGKGEDEYDWINIKFTLHDVICHVMCAILGTLYLYNKVIFFFNLYKLCYYCNAYFFKKKISTGLQTIYLD